MNKMTKQKVRVRGVKNRIAARLQKSKEKQSPGYVILSLAFRVFDHAVLGKAAELAYYFLFSFLPLIIFGSSLLALMNLDTDLFSEAAQFIPQDVLELTGSFYEFIQGGQSTTLMITGLALSIYFASAAVRSLMRSLDVAYGVKTGRNPFLQFIMSLFFAVIFLATIVVSLLLMVAGGFIIDLIVEYIPILSQFQWIINILRFAVMIIPIFGIFMLLYLFTPHRKLTVRSAVPGSVFSMLAWIAVSMVFSYYVSHFGRYATLYGSLGTIIVLMLWLFLTGLIFIMGGELNAVLLERKHYLEEKRLLDDGDVDESAEPGESDE